MAVVKRASKARALIGAVALVACALGVDMMLTGHSLGRNKLDHLLKSREPAFLRGWGMVEEGVRWGVCVFGLCV